MRLMLRVMYTVSVSAAVVAIILGLRNDRGSATVFLVVALVGAAVSWVVFRRYSVLRSNRWERELSGSEDELKELLGPQVVRGAGSEGTESTVSAIRKSYTPARHKHKGKR